VDLSLKAAICLGQNALIPSLNAFLSKEELQKKFEKININKNSEVVFSCGSGVTACIVAKAFEIIDGKKFSVYDGSWTEWASQ
jgi:thiosulfate/3-mercaptopyruvate sulfurtransferase